MSSVAPTSAPDAPLRLDFKSGLLAGVASVELLEKGIQVKDRHGRPRFLAYTDIALVRLRHTPRRDLPEFYICKLEPRAGKPMRFGSLTMAGFPKGYVLVPYRAFVKELHARILAAGGRPQFWAGQGTGQMILGLLGTIVVTILLLIKIGSDTRITGWAVLPMLAIVAWLLWIQIRSLRASEARRYDPRAIPDDVLPKDPA